MIKCNGKCNECEALRNGEIEDFEACAITTTQRRSFETLVRINAMSEDINTIKTLLEENSQLKSKKKKEPITVEDL